MKNTSASPFRQVPDWIPKLEFEEFVMKYDEEKQKLLGLCVCFPVECLSSREQGRH